MSQTQQSQTALAGQDSALNIIREEGRLSIEFRKATGEYLVHEACAGVCTFPFLSQAVEYFNERLEANA